MIVLSIESAVEPWKILFLDHKKRPWRRQVFLCSKAEAPRKRLRLCAGSFLEWLQEGEQQSGPRLPVGFDKWVSML
jgi:hypothetical protein